jgi:tetratricopeptide (TPR) repeat protein
MSDESIERYEQMLAEDPRSRAFAPLAEAHRKAGRLDEAIRVARAGLEIHPVYSGGLVVLGRALYEKGELDNAAEILQKAVNETPESYLGQKFLGKVLMDRGENQAALNAFKAAYLLSPEDDEVERLLDEIKGKAEPPESLEYKADGTVEAEKAQIVTYEQKPTTIDGVELPPLPASETGEPFSFSGEEADGTAENAPVPGEQEFTPPGAAGGEMTPTEATAEDTTATVIEEEEVEQAMGMDSLEDLGPEAAAFMEEGEDLMADLMEESPGGEVPAGDGGMGQEMAEPVSFPPPTPEAPEIPRESAVSAGPSPSSAEPAVDSGTPVASSVPQEPASPGEDRIRLDSSPPGPAFSDSATAGEDAVREQPFSTETLADLYAQQGLNDKAVKIYRQILEKTPENEAVKLKLEALSVPPSPEPAAVQEVRGGEIAPAPPGKNSQETLSILEGMLENLERMKRS